MLEDYIAVVLFGGRESSESSHMPVCCELLLLPWSHFHLLSTGIARKGHSSVAAEEALGFCP